MRKNQSKAAHCQSKVEVKSLEKQGFAKRCQSLIQACLDYGTEGDERTRKERAWVYLSR